MRHQGRLRFPRPLYGAVLHHRNPICNLRRRDDFPIPLGSTVPPPQLVRRWEVAVFLAILVVGYIWAYKKGALEWVEVPRIIPSVSSSFPIRFCRPLRFCG